MSGIIGGGDSGAKAASAQLAQAKAETERMRKQAEEERRDLSEEMAGKRRARAAGGSRMLLSDSRLNPEEGVDETLGAM